MAAFPDTELELPVPRERAIAQSASALVAALACILGLFSIWPTVKSLWSVWTTDALNSIGIFIPVVAFVLVARAWRKLGWASRGSWWGIALLLGALALTWCKQHLLLLLVISPFWVTTIPPRCSPLFLYGSGVVLLLGGTRLYRASLFPLALLWFGKPVPNVFSRLIDLPLQSLSAHIARSFALHLGQHLTPDNLRLMFTPEFGMFIAPGCDGIRGAVTMGFIALVAGYLYEFRPHVHALITAAAVLLGYIFNFARLCLLVLYYILALHLPWFQDKARNADLLIGAALFLFAATLLFHAIQRFRPAAPQVHAEQPVIPTGPLVRPAHLAALCAIGIFGLANFAYSEVTSRGANTVSVRESFPARLGAFALTRTWTEQLNTGAVVYYWAEYAPANGGTPVDLGISPILHWHDPIVCHTGRADYPIWQGPLTIQSGGSPMNFAAAVYSDGIAQRLELSTQCTGHACGEHTTGQKHFGLIYSRVQPDSGVSSEGPASVPVIVRTETNVPSLPAAAARQQLTAELQSFLAGADLADLARP